jgi:RimJ/RimL family protein N-acetyltransferase
MSANWFIRTYREGDENQIFELRKAVSSEQQREQWWLRWWHWMYQENPNGSKIWLAEDNGKIVGHYGGINVNLKVGNDIIKVPILLNSMTHPDYRHNGIMLTLRKNALAELAKNGMPITFGFPNEASLKINQKLGYYHLTTMRKFVRIFNWENTLRTQVSNKLFLKLCAAAGNALNKLRIRDSEISNIKGLTITQVSEFDERVNKFWAKVSKQFPIMVMRSKDYLNWRYATVPDINYSIYVADVAGVILGYIVLRAFQEKDKKAALIFDLLAESEEVAKCLLSTTSKHCQKDGVDYIYWVGIANEAYLRAFRKRGFISQPYRQSKEGASGFEKKGEFNFYSNSSNIPGEFLSDPQNWLIQIGDSDEL